MQLRVLPFKKILLDFDNIFEPLESDLVNPIETTDSINEKIMNYAFTEISTKNFIVFSWDVSRPGLWFSIEPYMSREQLKTRVRKSDGKQMIHEYRSIGKEIDLNKAYPYGAPAFFQTIYSNRVYYGIVLMVGDYTRCLSNLIKLEAHVLKHPLTIHQLLIPEANLIKLSNKNYNSCRSNFLTGHII